MNNAMIYLYRINTGSCGGCDIAIGAAVVADASLAWADSPYNADALLLTGPATVSSREPLLRLLREVGELPIVAVGRCAIDGHPFGRGGVRELRDLVVQVQVEGCPPAPKEIAAAIHTALGHSEVPIGEAPTDTTDE